MPITYHDPDCPDCEEETRGDPDDFPLYLRRAPGTCCPEPSCDNQVAPAKCTSCGAICPCRVWELAGRELILKCRMCGATRPYREDDIRPCKLCGAALHWDIANRHEVTP